GADGRRPHRSRQAARHLVSLAPLPAPEALAGRRRRRRGRRRSAVRSARPPVICYLAIVVRALHLRVRSTMRSSDAGARGFTLVELMVVVVIVGILATVGVALLRKHIFTSKTAEVV